MDILPQLLINTLITGSIYALASSGLSLSYGLLKILNFAHGQMMTVGVYIFYLLTAEHGISVFAAFPLTMIFTLLLSTIILYVFILPFSRYGIVLPFISTLALATILESLISIFFGVNVKSLSTGSFAESIEIGPTYYITPIQIIIFSSAIVFLIILAFFIHHTKFGRAIRSLSENSYAAASLGISSAKVSLYVFGLSAILATYSGILVGYETNIQPTMGNIYTIKAFAVMILGGLGNIWGTIAASFLLGLIENLSIGIDIGNWSLPVGYKDAFAYFVILLVLLFKPEGLFTRAKRKT
ncbi:MAG: branched-chain amino acid ABC transporter permease [Deltaproteobacteria bacterium]|nr:branched-chain amino acid ABC transporter permease [Deltaproteobacteria bacterium]